MTPFVCLVLLKESVRGTFASQVGDYSPANQTLSRMLFYEFIPDQQIQNSKHVAACVREICKRHKISHERRIYVIHEHYIRLLPGSLRSHFVPEPCFLNDLKKTLDGIFNKNATNWLLILENDLKDYFHKDEFPPNPGKWLDQFEALDEKRWIGERLLQSLDYWSPSRVAGSFNLKEIANKIENNSDLVLCVNLNKLGSSGTVLIAALHRKIKPHFKKQTKLVPQGICDAIKESGEAKIIYLEDGLFTGHQQLGLFVSLTESEGFCETFKKKEIEIRFASVANYGYSRLKSFLREEGWENTSIWRDDTTELRNFLTQEGMTALGKGELYKTEMAANTSENINIIKDVACFVQPEMFSNEQLWRSESQRGTAMAFCRKIGRQLIDIHQKQKGLGWSTEKIEECALGMQGQALSIVFFHSAPKGGIPLFWAKGNVSCNGKETLWEPLFPRN